MTSNQAQSAPLDEALVSDLMERVRDLFNGHDPDGFGAVMTEDVVMDHPMVDGTMHGFAEIGAFYSSLWKAMPDARIDLADGPFIHPHAPRVILKWRATGTNTGPLDPPGLPSTGRSFQFHVWETFDVRDGRPSRVTLAYDTAGRMRQLGVLPAQGSRAERGMVALQRLRMKLSRRR